ncbi:MAG: hypothetical protein P8N49_05220 [Opitutales bacterium]|nr:hypothetical protein [Opitutales bacterium]
MITIIFRLFILSFFFFLLHCGTEESSENQDLSPATWQGSDEEFESQFELETEKDYSTILINSNTKNRFEGILETRDLNASKIKKYKNGKLNGLSVLKSKDGSRVEANYSDGILHGEMILYDDQNKIRSIIHYRNGVVVPIED